MKRLFIFLALVWVVPAFSFGEPATLSDNLDAQIIVSRYDKAIADAKRTYDIAASKAAAAAVKDLQKVQEYETKAGRLEVAVAVKRKIEELQALTVVPNDASGTALQNPELVKFLLGEWTSQVQGPWTFTKTNDGGLYLVEGCTGNHSVKWACVGKNAIVFQWSNGDDAILIERVGNDAKLSCWQRFFSNKTFGPVHPSGQQAYWSGMALQKNK
jgi:hypothetical protein